jgi:hypothetical protein
MWIQRELTVDELREMEVEYTGKRDEALRKWQEYVAAVDGEMKNYDYGLHYSYQDLEGFVRRIKQYIVNGCAILELCIKPKAPPP